MIFKTCLEYSVCVCFERKNLHRFFSVCVCVFFYWILIKLIQNRESGMRNSEKDSRENLTKSFFFSKTFSYLDNEDFLLKNYSWKIQIKTIVNNQLYSKVSINPFIILSMYTFIQTHAQRETRAFSLVSFWSNRIFFWIHNPNSISCGWVCIKRNKNEKKN